jgi:hypothetical protein
MKTGIALTNPLLPSLRIVKAVRRGRFISKVQEAFIPQEDTAWLDTSDNTIYYAEANCDITDFASTPRGDGAKGYLRFGGRLHDLMGKATPVLVPENQEAIDELIFSHTTKRNDNSYLTVAEILRIGWKRERRDLSIWEAAGIYKRILESIGFPAWRATVHQVGLRLFQRFYRWWWAGGLLEPVDDPNWRDTHGYFKNK